MQTKTTRYRILKSCIDIDGKKKTMYGIKASCNTRIITVSSVSEDRVRIFSLVKNLNRSGMDIDRFYDTIAPFFKEYD